MANRVLPDHNGGVTQKIILDIVGKYDNIQRRMMALKTEEKNLKKSAEDDGVDWAVMKEALKYRNSPEAEQAKRENQKKLYLMHMGVPIAARLANIDENFNAEVGLTDEQRQDKWREEGYRGALSNKGLDAVMGDHDPNLIAGRCIREGWEKGQAENAKGIKKGPAKVHEDKSQTAAPAAAAEDKVSPKHEPEVAEAAKKRGRPPKAKGVSYWHRADVKKVYEVPQSEANPEGAVNITVEEYEKLKAEYDKAESDDWDAAPIARTPESTSAEDAPPPPED